jgi:hypothetical protein
MLIIYNLLLLSYSSSKFIFKNYNSQKWYFPEVVNNVCSFFKIYIHFKILWSNLNLKMRKLFAQFFQKASRNMFFLMHDTIANDRHQKSKFINLKEVANHILTFYVNWMIKYVQSTSKILYYSFVKQFLHFFYNINNFWY